MTIDPRERQADAAAARGDVMTARALLVAVTTADPGRYEPWLKLAAMSRAAGDPRAALIAIEGALAIVPLDFTALLMRATLLDATGQAATADEAFGRALAQAPANPPAHLGPVLATARQRFSRWQTAQADTLRAVAPDRSAALDRMITNAVHLTKPDRTGPTHYCYPNLPEIAFHDRARFPWLADLEAATSEIAGEFAAVAAAEAADLVPYINYPTSVPLAQWKALNNNRDWTAIHLIERGVVNPRNAQHCPRTMDMLRSIPQPEIPGAGPNAMFSLLAPHTHIPPHTGITNTRLVFHLPLIVPPGCWFRVGDDRRDWVAGKAWVFDDTIEHEAMNPADALRVILIVDVWHPDLDAATRRGVAAVIGAGGRVHGL